MFKLIRNTLLGALVIYAVGHLLDFGSRPADRDELDPASGHVAPGSTASRAMGRSDDLCALPSDAIWSSPELEGAEACELAAALADDPARRGAALLAAARALRGVDDDAADSRAMLAAADGAVDALLAFGSAPPADAMDALVRREALLAAESSGSEDAGRQLREGVRGALRAQALTRPEQLAALVEGSGLTLPDTVADRRYLGQVAQSLESTCPFEAGLFRSVGFITARSQYLAPLNALAQERLARGASAAVSDSMSAFTHFVRGLVAGGRYQAEATTLMRDLREVGRSVDNAGATGSAAGARDGVRVATALGGCSSPDVLRLARGLMAVFSERSRRPPDATAHKES